MKWIAIILTVIALIAIAKHAQEGLGAQTLYYLKWTYIVSGILAVFVWFSVLNKHLNKMSNIECPPVGSFFASKSDDFIGKGIQEAAKIKAKRTNTYHGQTFWNHFGAIVLKDGVSCAAEALSDGFNIHPWATSRYALNKVEFINLELYRPWTKEEMFAFNASLLAIEGLPYDFEGIADQADFVSDGTWNGLKGLEAQKRMYCSEAILTKVNDLRKNAFPYPWCISPQMAVENPNILKSVKQYYIKPV